MRTLRAFSLIFVLLLTTQLSADESVTMEKANQLFAAEAWKEAAAAYEQLLKTDPANDPASYNLAMSLQQLGQSDRSMALFEQLSAKNYRPLMTLYQLARVNASKGDRHQTIHWMKRPKAAGPVPVIVSSFSPAPEFAALRKDPAFMDLVATMRPCSSTEYRQFDFWIGDWRVENPQGQPVGENLVTREQDGCLLFEHWKSQSGSSGFSVNYFDSRDRQWHQLYYDNTGSIGNWPPLQGTLVNGSMALSSPKDSSPLTRWTWTRLSADRVRQAAESSSDGGKTWTNIWDSVYVRKK